jgi:nucleoside-diphosphate-sugar epimerase
MNAAASQVILKDEKASTMILVTGPDGFVGNEVCRELLRRGAAVRGGQWRAAPLPDGCKSVVIGDIGPDTNWSAALVGVDVVIHLAARVHIMKDVSDDPLAEFRRINVDGTRRLAEAAAEAGVKRLVFLSTVKVNGESTNPASFGLSGGKGQFVEMDPPRPEDAYGVSKWEAEEVLREIEKNSGMEVTILRSPLIYGPGVKANYLKLIRLVDRGIPLPFGGIQNKRSLISLTNLVDLICCCLKHPAASGNTFLVSDGDDVSTPELVRRIAQALGKHFRLLPIPGWMMIVGGVLTGKTMQIKRLCGSLQIDSSKVRRVLSWTPPSSMAEELAKMAKWYREQQAKSGN